MPPKPFKPPRPSSATTSSKSGPGRPRKSDTTSTSTAAAKRKSNSSITKSAPTPKRRISAREMGLPSLSPETDADEDEAEGEVSDDPFASQPSTKPQKQKRRRETEGDEEDGISDGEAEKEKIPGDLLSVLLHEFFTDGTRMTKGANKAVGKYLDVFVREGVARCVFRAGGDGVDGDGGGVVEVEDLEKEAPQLLLDF